MKMQTLLAAVVAALLVGCASATFDPHGPITSPIANGGGTVTLVRHGPIEWPADADAAKLSEGFAVMRLQIDDSGKVVNVLAVTASNRAFVRAAAKSWMQSQWRLDGHAPTGELVAIDVPMTFKRATPFQYPSNAQ